MPTLTQFKENYLDTLINSVIQEILQEPSFHNTNKALFLEECMKSIKWSDFVNTLSDEISIFLFNKQTKILPMNQYEEMQKKLNSYLNLNSDRLKEYLLSCSSVNIANTEAGRLVFRMTTKFFQGATQWITRTMRDDQIQEAISFHQTFSEIVFAGFKWFSQNLL